MASLKGLALVAGSAMGLFVSGAALAVVGPDVVVSTIGSTYTKYGTKDVGSGVLVSGYAVTTVSCNIGDADAEWFDVAGSGHLSNEHPVIGTQLYRLYGGRFEQIGMSWLKHGFCAADAPNCLNLGPAGATTRINNSCDWLGLYETDTYDASLNGSQGNCGPRSEVNPVTGAYPYPYILGAGATGDCVYKRLQVANADLAPANYPGARYFTEVHYITTDESSTTRANNASYRETLVGSLSNSGSGCVSTVQGYALVLSGGTVALKPAIEAWKTIDPTVVLSYVDVPNDGRIIVGCKVTDVGNGDFQYEYAVYNHNSERAVGSFSIAKTDTPAYTISNLGFHDVAYHSGEPYSGTDWTGVVNPTSIDFATQTAAQNPNANAIRWSTTYNFRFRANQPPTTGNVTLGLFKTGTPATVDATGLLVPSIPAVLCPADFNHSGGSPTVQDIFDFLAAYFANDPAADFNGVGGLSVQDIFDFLAAYFTACP
jgi:hypothetical protein